MSRVRLTGYWAVSVSLLLIALICSRFVSQSGCPSCDRCGALVSPTLMGLHLDWHRAQDGSGTRFFELAADEPSLEQLLTVVAALKAVALDPASPAFVAELRARLVAEARIQPNLQLVTPEAGGCPD